MEGKPAQIQHNKLQQSATVGSRGKTPFIFSIGKCIINP